MKETILTPIMLGVVASAVVTGCGGDRASENPPAEKSVCVYDIQGGNTVSIPFGASYTNASAKVTKEGKKVIFTLKGAVNSSQLGKHEITYTGEKCNNSQVRVVTVVPSSCAYKLTGDNPLKINVGDTFVEPGFEVKDINNKAIKGIATGAVDSNKLGQYKITYTSESCKNTQVRTVNVVSSVITPPVPPTPSSCAYELTGDNPLVVKLGDAFVEPGFAVKDSNNKVVNGIATGKVDSNKLGQYKVTYSSESCKNSQVRTVNVVPSAITPSSCAYELTGDNPLEVKLGYAFVEPGFAVKDSNNKTVKGIATGTVDSNKLGQYEITYSSESCKNSQVRMVNVLASLCDYQIIGDNPVEISLSGTYQEQGVSIKNANNQPVTGTVSGAVDMATVGGYIITYQSEGCTNTATRAVKVVLADCTYTLTGDNPLLVNKEDTFIDPGVTVKDSSGVEVTSIVSGEVDTTTLGDYTLTYQGKNCANSQVRTVQVTLQTCVYTLLGDSPLEVLLNTLYVDSGAEIKDSKGTVLEAKAMGAGSVDNTKVGQYVITYKLEACGNSMDRIVKVRALTDDELKDTILPQI